MADYGFPKESRRPVQTIKLDLPVEIGSVEDPTGDRPPIKVFGPYDADEEGVDLGEYDPVTPIDHEINENVVKFPFEEPFGRGMYKVVVYQSRIYRSSNGEAIELTVDETGEAWRGWQFQVLDETVSQPRPGNQRTVTRGRDRPKVEVFLDGNKVPSGSSELSGEVLTVESTGSAQISMETEPLLSKAPAESMYSCFRGEVAESKEVDHETVYVRHFASAGPVGKMKWAHYHETPTVGKLPVDDDKEAKVGIPVVRPVKRPDNDPLLTWERSTESPSVDHENTYQIVHYCAEPQTPGLGFDSYRSTAIVAPETINNDANTPDINPKIYPDAVYKEDADDLPSQSMKAGVFDLPLNSEVRVKVNGRVRWWGQTRMLPALVSPRDANASIDHLNVETRESRTKLLRDIWKASMEALELWGSSLPTDAAGQGVVVSTMRDFVLTRLAIGSPYQEGIQGEASGEQGGQQFSAQGDRAMRRRLHALSQLLKEGEANAPIMPEDDLPTAQATVGAEAGLTFRTAAGRTQTNCLIPTYEPMDYYPIRRHRRNLWLQNY